MHAYVPHACNVWRDQKRVLDPSRTGLADGDEPHVLFLTKKLSMDSVGTNLA